MGYSVINDLTSRTEEKTTFKIATKGYDANTEVEGYVRGNWGLTNHREGEEDKNKWFIYHVKKGLIFSYCGFDWEVATKALELVIELFGENSLGERTPENLALKIQWEDKVYPLLPDCDDDLD